MAKPGHTAKLTDRNPLDESALENEPLLGDLQCNILSSNGRPNTHYFFLKFPNGAAAKGVLRALASAKELPRGLKLESEAGSRTRRREHLAAATPKGREPSAFSANLLLSARCYNEFLGDFTTPPDAAFRQGMATRDGSLGSAVKLNDPPVSEEASPVHAVYVVGYDPEAADWAAVKSEIITLLRSADVSVREEAGYVLRHPTERYPIEPFGYRDAISQPLFFKADLAARRKYEGAAATVEGGRWSSFAPLSTVLVPDPNGDTDQSFGTYIAYRKIKQKVDFFYDQATQLAQQLADPALSRDDIADRLIGRQVDGTPLDQSPDLNNFTYPSNSACPMHAHARKVNPRNQYVGNRRIVRRATVFGPKLRRDVQGRPAIPTKPQEGETSGDVGLLFFCCQANIAGQFEAIQAQWANNASAGADTVIGQLPPSTKNKIGFNGSGLKFDYEPVVKVMEGEYFFAPSIKFFSRL